MIKVQPLEDGNFMAYDEDLYDCDFDYDSGRFVPTCPVGYGPTRDEAIADLNEQTEAVND